jgi:hypothetical protein
MLLPRRNVVVCLCGHNLTTHLIGICTVPTCPCVRYPAPGPPDNGNLMPCDRCAGMDTVLYVLRTEILDMTVCQGCAEIAVDLGIVTAETQEPMESSSA